MIARFLLSSTPFGVDSGVPSMFRPGSLPVRGAAHIIAVSEHVNTLRSVFSSPSARSCRLAPTAPWRGAHCARDARVWAGGSRPYEWKTSVLGRDGQDGV